MLYCFVALSLISIKLGQEKSERRCIMKVAESFLVYNRFSTRTRALCSSGILLRKERKRFEKTRDKRVPRDFI